MRSSEPTLQRVAAGVLLAAMLAACSGAGGRPDRVLSTSSVEPECEGLPSIDSDAAGKELRTVVQGAKQAPLFAAAIARSGIASCQVTRDGSAFEVTYRARDGSSFRFRRDSAIESSEFEARFAAPPADEPRQLLARSEAGAFGPRGCGINWAKPGEAVRASGGGPATVYRGLACNCQGRVEREASGEIVGLVFSSAC